MSQKYDLLIIGTGPAGLTAALYGARLGLHTIVFGNIPGGSTSMIEKIDNFPAFPDGISGPQFGVFTFQQAQQQGAVFAMERLRTLTKTNDQFVGTTGDEQQFTATCAIVASGRIPKRLPLPGASLPGIHFCSLCDGPLYRGQNATLAVIGDDNTAAQHALTLSRIADKVLLITRKKHFTMDDIHRRQLSNRHTVTLLSETEVLAYLGKTAVQGLSVKHADDSKRDIAVSAVFLVIGWRPNNTFLQIPVDTTPEGYLKTDTQLMSKCSGLFVAGDVRDTDMRQVLTACADGARAAKYAADFIENRSMAAIKQ